MSIESEVIAKAGAAKSAARRLAHTSAGVKDKVLKAMAKSLVENAEKS